MIYKKEYNELTIELLYREMNRSVSMSLTPIRVIFCLLTYPSSIDHRVNKSANKVSLPWLNAKITESTTSSFNSLKTKTVDYFY